ncbi:hypothetical protein ACVD4U_004202 [Vibrio vulnificus]
MTDSYEVLDDSFTIEEAGEGSIHKYPFKVNDIDFVCWMTELNVDIPEIVALANRLRLRENLPAGERAYTVDFDRISNILADTNFEEPGEGEAKLGPRGLGELTRALTEIISIHSELTDAKFYFAQPASERLSALYNKMLVPKLLAEGYNYYEDEDGDGWYVFKKQNS